MRRFSRRRYLLILILLAAAALRFWQLDGLGFNSDEAVYSGQAAAIALDDTLSDFFPVFRAHPLLFQFLLSLVFRLHISDLAARSLSAFVGVATVLLVFQLGRELYGEKVGLASSLLLGLMPYHVVVTRQVLLDGTMTLFATLTLFLLVRYANTQRSRWMYGVGAALGLTFLSKETGIILMVAIFAFFALAPSIRLRLRDLGLSLAVLALVIAPYPLTIALAGGQGAETTQQYLIWQLFRRPNHEWTFYPLQVTGAMGYLLVASALVGLLLHWRGRTWREVALLSWILVPATFFQTWPVKGFHYLLLLAPPVALLAGRALTEGPMALDGLPRSWPAAAPVARWAGLTIVSLSLLIPSIQRVQPSPTGEFLAGSGGVPGGREAGHWLRDNSPIGSTLMTIGPSMGNILQFYGHRRAFGLSVSPNPLHRNPSYQPIRNPDFEIRTGEFQYLVWDSYSASRSDFFSEKLLDYARRYDGRVVHSQTVPALSPEGLVVEKPVIVIYEVRP